MPDLRHSLFEIDVVEMHRVDAQQTGRRHDKPFKRGMLQVAAIEAVAARQKQATQHYDRPTRHDHVAELQPLVDRPAVIKEAEIDVYGDAVDVEVGGRNSARPVPMSALFLRMKL